MQKKSIRFVFLPLMTSLFFSSVTTGHHSASLERDMKDAKRIAETNRIEAPSDNFDIQVIDSEKSFISEVESFNFSSSVAIDNITSEGNITLTSYSYKDNLVSCTLSGFTDASEVLLNFYHDNKLIDRCALYFAMSDDGILYSSGISLDTAKRSAGQEIGYNLVDDSEEYLPSSSEPSISLYGIGASGMVYGTLRWTDEQGNTHPLVGAKVRTTMSMSWWSSETYTDINGYYKIDYTDIWHLFGGIPMVHIYSENDNVKVHNGGSYEKKYEFGSGSGGEYSYTFSPITDGDMGKAMMIFQGAKNFSDYAEYLNGGTPIEFCNFQYPVAGDTSFYDGNGTVSISSGRKKYEYLPESYAAWDVIGHEYGHHVQKVFQISSNPGGRHAIGQNNIDDQKNSGFSLDEAKGRGHKLSWGEAWPTYWSTVAQSHFNDDLKSIYTVGDTLYTAHNGPDYDLNSYGYGSGRGDADEQSIQRFLYKLCDSSTDKYDKFALGETTLWNIVVANKPVTFSQFIEDLYDDGYDKHDLGLLLDQYNVIVGKIDAVNYQYFDKLPTFSWSTYMGSNYLRFNQFDLYFETPTGSLIQKISNISATGDTATYSPTSDIWKKIDNASGSEFNVYFVARQTDYYTSGNYYSEISTFDKPSTFSSDKIQIKPNEWGFDGRYFFPDEIEDIHSIDDDTHNMKYSTLTKGDLIITTERLRCGYIENSYINLSPRRKDAGEAYLELNFNKPVYSVLYSLGLWSGNENLDGGALIKIKDSSGTWSKLKDISLSLLNTKGQGLLRYTYYSAEGIYGIRFECSATPSGDRNKGRLSIDDIVLSTKSGLSNNQYYLTNYGKTEV